MTHDSRTRLGGSPRRSLLIWAALLVVVVGAGLLGRLGSSPAPRRSPPAVAVASPPRTTPTPTPTAATRSFPPGILITAPLPGAVEHGQSVRIVGRVIGSAPAVEISIRVGGQVVGATDLLVAAAGGFGGSVPLQWPMAGAPATLTVRTVDRPDVVSVPITLDASVPVFVRLPDGSSLAAGPSSRLYPILGTAEGPVDRVTAALQDGAGAVLASGVSFISANPMGGTFGIALSLPLRFRGSGLSLRLGWTEPATGATGHVTLPLTGDAFAWQLPAAPSAGPPSGMRRYSDGTFSFDFPTAWQQVSVAYTSASPTPGPGGSTTAVSPGSSTAAAAVGQTLVLLGTQTMHPTCMPDVSGSVERACSWGLDAPLLLGAIVARWDVAPIGASGASLAFPGASIGVGQGGRLTYELPGACAVLGGSETIVFNTMGPLAPPRGGQAPGGRYRLTACLAGSGPDLERNEAEVFAMLASAAWR